VDARSLDVETGSNLRPIANFATGAHREPTGNLPGTFFRSFYGKLRSEWPVGGLSEADFVFDWIPYSASETPPTGDFWSKDLSGGLSTVLRRFRRKRGSSDGFPYDSFASAIAAKAEVGLLLT
jgi:hypothetical protein